MLSCDPRLADTIPQVADQRVLVVQAHQERAGGQDPILGFELLPQARRGERRTVRVHRPNHDGRHARGGSICARRRGRIKNAPLYSEGRVINLVAGMGFEPMTFGL